MDKTGEGRRGAKTFGGEGQKMLHDDHSTVVVDDYFFECEVPFLLGYVKQNRLFIVASSRLAQESPEREIVSYEE